LLVVHTTGKSIILPFNLTVALNCLVLRIK
jgi:hypothetical protein